jgi:hypothetical protein
MMPSLRLDPEARVYCPKPDRAVMPAAMPDAPAAGSEQDGCQTLGSSPLQAVQRSAKPKRAERRPSGSMRRAFGLALAALLAGCAGTASPPLVTDAEATAELPLAALQVGDDLYQEPIGHDADGCLMYRLFSPTTLVTPAISYRSIEGGFTLKRRLALCAPGHDGKEAFEAVASGVPADLDRDSLPILAPGSSRAGETAAIVAGSPFRAQPVAVPTSISLSSGGEADPVPAAQASALASPGDGPFDHRSAASHSQRPRKGTWNASAIDG